MPKIHGSRWGVHLEGFEYDIKNLTWKLNLTASTEDSFFVTIIDDTFILRSRRWDAAKDFQQLRGIIDIDLTVIKGCMSLLDGGADFNIGTYIEFDENHNIVNLERVQTVRIEVRPTQEDLSKPQEFADALKTIQNDEILNVALREYQDIETWYGIYRCLEALKKLYKTEAKLFSSLEGRSSEIARLKRTANYYRHTNIAFAEIRNPMGKRDAAQLLSEILLHTVKLRFKGSSPANEEWSVWTYTADGKKIGLDPVVYVQRAEDSLIWNNSISNP